MRISADVKPLQKQMRELHLEIQNRLDALVMKTASSIANIASGNTPIGDSDSLEGNANYRRLYEMRQQRFSIPVEVGFHRGAWVYSETPSVDFSNKINSPSEMLQGVQADLYTSYQLGETFYIAAKGPAYGILNSGANRQAPDGIVAPTVQEVIEIYKLNIQTFFQQG